MPLPRVSAIVVARDRHRDLDACLRGLREQTDRRLELLVVLDRPSAEVERLVERAAAADPRVRRVPFEGGSPSVARNAAASTARGDLLWFLDDDVLVPPEGVATLIGLADAHPDVTFFGGPNLTPPDEPAFAHLTGALLATRWGAAVVRDRYRVAPEGPAGEESLILCNLAARRRWFERGAAFPPDFGGEENVLLGQAAGDGRRAWYAPELWVHHRRRRTLRGYASQMFRYGWGRANAIVNAPGTSHPAYFAPPAFLLYLLALPVALPWLPLAWLPLALYALCTALASVSLVVQQRAPQRLPAALALYPITHLCYGAGLALRLAQLGARPLRARATRPS